MDYLFISDYFIEDGLIGGAELADMAIINGLIQRGHSVSKIRSRQCDNNPEFLNILANKNTRIIVSNFFEIDTFSRNSICDRGNYLIYEHDFKMIRSRDPNIYENKVAPKSDIVNSDFYKKAFKVICQSNRHRDVVNMNLPLDNIEVSKGNPYKQSTLDLLEALSFTPKNGIYAILKNHFPKKNTIGTINFALENNIEFTVLNITNHERFLIKLSSYYGMIFMPLAFETFSRVSFEARCLGLEIIGNENISFLYEPYAKLKGIDLINFARENYESIITLFE
jgi:hypothetical protein